MDTMLHDDDVRPTPTAGSAFSTRLRWAAVVVSAVVLGGAGGSILTVQAVQDGAAYADATQELLVPPAVAPAPSRVAARGRLEPSGGVIRIAGPAARQPAVVSEIKVAEGDWIEKDQVIAVLDGVPALSATVQRLEALTRNAQGEMRRFVSLCRDGIASGSECDAIHLRLETAQADLARARADLATSFVRAPQAGRVLRVHADAGERVDSAGIVEIGDTRTMDVVAEIYETDAPLLRRGQVARIHTSVLPEALAGQVERIGMTISKQSVFDLNPAASTDSRIVEARIRVATPAAVAALIHLQVDVEIEVEAAAVAGAGV